MSRMPEVELGEVTGESYLAFREAFAATFGSAATPAEVDWSRGWIEYERLIAARTVDGQIVGTSGAYPFQVSLPGERSARCAGVTVVSVRGDHRRRGLLTRMMARLLDDAHERGEPFAALWASESPIYGRYGFGPAVPTIDVRLDHRHAALRVDGPVDEVRLVSVEEAREAFPALHEAWRRSRGGVMSRSAAWWSRTLTERPQSTEPTGPRRLALLPDRGYIVYHLEADWTDGVPQGTVHVEDLVAHGPAATAALWRFVTDTDLAQTTEVMRRPPDDPLLAMLMDPARAKVTVGWPLYLRLVDLPVAMAARGYLTDGSIVLDVTDGFRPANSGRWRLTVSAGQGDCARTEDAAELTMDAEALATIALGGVRSTTLLSAGRIQGSMDAGVRLDQLLSVDHAPSSEEMF